MNEAMLEGQLEFAEWADSERGVQEKIGNGDLDSAARVVAEGLERCGIGRDELVAEDLIVSSGETLVLHGHPRQKSPLARGTAWLQTGDLDVMKRWVGLPNQIASSKIGFTFAPAELPEPAVLEGRETFSSEEQEILNRALKAYLYGQSAGLQAYKPLLEEYRAFLGRQHPGLTEGFVIGVWRARRIVIEAGGLLVITGPLASALIVDEMDIHAGGTLNIQSIAYLNIGTLRKLEKSQGEGANETSN